jgi:hypothetical protein
MKDKEYKVKVGDKLIANDAFNSFGYVEGVVTKITPYNSSVKLVNVPSDVTYGVTIFATLKAFNDITGESWEYHRDIETCNVKINPENTDINIDWTNYNLYCKAIFFTSEEEKKKFYNRQREDKMNYHLRMAKSFGYVEN